MSHIAEADAHYAREYGYDHQDQAWVLSDRDVWYRNPFYQGPAVPHPEDDDGCYDVEPGDPGAIDAPAVVDEDPFAGEYVGGAYRNDPLDGEDFSGGRF